MRKHEHPGALPMLVLIIVLAGSVGLMQAQSDFRPGYFVYNSGDTVRALINFEKTTVCEFKLDHEKKQLGPTEITGFGFENDRFYSSTVLSGRFLEVIVDGYLSLYKSDKAYFIKKSNDALVRLEEDKQGSEESQNRSDDIQWKGKLKFVLKDCNDHPDDIDIMRFSETDLLKKVIAYNNCKKENYVEYKSKIPALKISPGLGFGIGYSRFGLKNAETVTVIPTKFNSLDPVPVLLLNFFSPKVSSKISIQAEIQWKRLLTSSNIEFRQPPKVINRETMINISFLSLPVYLKYTLPMDNKTMAFYFGFLYDKLLQQKTKVLTAEHLDNTVTNTSLIDPYDFNLPQFGFGTGMSYGISISKINLSTHLKYNFQGLTADSLLKKDGKFEFEFRRSSLLNRFSLVLAIQMR